MYHSIMWGSYEFKLHADNMESEIFSVTLSLLSTLMLSSMWQQMLQFFKEMLENNSLYNVRLTDWLSKDKSNHFTGTLTAQSKVKLLLVNCHGVVKLTSCGLWRQMSWWWPQYTLHNLLCTSQEIWFPAFLIHWLSVTSIMMLLRCYYTVYTLTILYNPQNKMLAPIAKQRGELEIPLL